MTKTIHQIQPFEIEGQPRNNLIQLLNRKQVGTTNQFFFLEQGHIRILGNYIIIKINKI